MFVFAFFFSVSLTSIPLSAADAGSDGFDGETEPNNSASSKQGDWNIDPS